MMSPGTVSMLAHALGHAQRGFAVFALAPRSKVPIAGSRGLLDATHDLAVIREMWRAEPHANVAIATGPTSGVFVVDVDNGPGKVGFSTMKALVAEHGDLPPTLRARTANGVHLFFVMPSTPVRTGANILGQHVDTRAAGGYVVAPGSIHPSGAVYRWSTSFEPATCPEWLASLVAPPTPAPLPPPRELPRSDVSDRAARWTIWMSEHKPSIEGSNGSGALYAVAVGLVIGFELPDAHALDLIRVFNATAKPLWPERDLVRVVQRAGRSNRPRGYLLNQPKRAA
jgi:hypothetical protein